MSEVGGAPYYAEGCNAKTEGEEGKEFNHRSWMSKDRGGRGISCAALRLKGHGRKGEKWMNENQP